MRILQNIQKECKFTGIHANNRRLNLFFEKGVKFILLKKRDISSLHIRIPQLKQMKIHLFDSMRLFEFHYMRVQLLNLIRRRGFLRG